VFVAADPTLALALALALLIFGDAVYSLLVYCIQAKQQERHFIYELHFINTRDNTDMIHWFRVWSLQER